MQKGDAMALTVKVTERDTGVFIIAPVGSIDAPGAELLEKEIDAVVASGPKVVIFDMKGVHYMSSAGVRVILKAKKALPRAGDALALVNLQPQIRKVFDIIRALPAQEIFESVEQLDAYLAEMQRREAARNG